MTDPKKICTLLVKVYEDGTSEINAKYSKGTELGIATLLSSMISGALPMAVINHLEEEANTNAKKKSVRVVVDNFNTINEQLVEEIDEQLGEDDTPVVGPDMVFLDIMGMNKRRGR